MASVVLDDELIPEMDGLGVFDAGSPDGLGEYLDEQIGAEEAPHQAPQLPPTSGAAASPPVPHAAPPPPPPRGPRRVAIGQEELPPLPPLPGAPTPSSARWRAGGGLLLLAASAGAGAVVAGGWGAAAGAMLMAGSRNALRSALTYDSPDPETRAAAGATALAALVGLGVGGYFAYRAYQARTEAQ